MVGTVDGGMTGVLPVFGAVHRAGRAVAATYECRAHQRWVPVESRQIARLSRCRGLALEPPSVARLAWVFGG
jgi:hypothetical protein